MVRLSILHAGCNGIMPEPKLRKKPEPILRFWLICIYVLKLCMRKRAVKYLSRFWTWAGRIKCRILRRRKKWHRNPMAGRSRILKTSRVILSCLKAGNWIALLSYAMTEQQPAPAGFSPVPGLKTVTRWHGVITAIPDWVIPRAGRGPGRQTAVFCITVLPVIRPAKPGILTEY